MNLNIIRNTANNLGGGIQCEEAASPLVKNVLLSQNRAWRGGGIHCEDNSAPWLANVIITMNTAMNGGGIYYDESGLVLDPTNRCSIYLNHAETGLDLYFKVKDSHTIQVNVDTFTVMTPTNYHTFPVNNFNFDILHAKLDPIKADLYVSPDGDDANSGLTPDDPLRTAFMALLKISADSLEPRTIHLADGVYSPSVTGEFFPLAMRNFVSLSGNSEIAVILDAEGVGNGLAFQQDKGINVENLTITGAAGTTGGIICVESDLRLLNMTIRGNTAYWFAGGIFSQESNLYLENVAVSENFGGGIEFERSTAVLENVTVANNYSGGGIHCQESTVTLENVTIRGNTTLENGGGIECSDSDLNLFGVTLTNNTAAFGGGIYSEASRINFDEQNRCNIHSNQAYFGHDLFSDNCPVTAVIVDTFSVMKPTDYHAVPMLSFTFDILDAKINQVSVDLFVSPNGDDSHTGLSPAQALRTLSHAQSIIFADSLNPRIIHLDDGIYSASTNGETFPVSVISHVTLSGSMTDNVILDAEDQTIVMAFGWNEGIATVQNLTVVGGKGELAGGIWCMDSRPRLVNLNINDCTSSNHGGGIYCMDSSPRLANLKISDCSAANGGGGIYFDGTSNPYLENVLIFGNSAGANGGGIYASWNSSLIGVNVTVCDNTAADVGGICCYETILVNCILWGNSPQQIAGLPELWTIVYSDIAGQIREDRGNIDANPSFVDTAKEDYSLSDISPCIGAGIDAIEIDSTWYYAPTTDINGNPRPNPASSKPDIGVYESDLGFPMDVSDGNDERIPRYFSLSQSYPNPFNPVTTILYQLPKSVFVNLSIFNYNGQLVETVVSQNQERGYYSIKWNANKFSSGVYLFRINAGEFSAVSKCLLLR
jgi:predicted outer membrane repeat protein